MFRIQPGAPRRGGALLHLEDCYHDYTEDDRAENPPPAVSQLNLRRDRVQGGRIVGIAGVTVSDSHVSITLEIGDPLPDERWLKSLVVSIETADGGCRIGSPIGGVSPSETGRFLHLKSHPLGRQRLSMAEVNGDTRVRLSSPNGWSWEAAASCIDFFQVRP